MILRNGIRSSNNTRPSSISSFCRMDSVTNEYDAEKKRQSDVYVFCVLKHKDQATLNPLDLSQWDFYVMSTAVLNKAAPGQKTISLRSLLDKGAKQCEYAMLYETIKSEGAR
jgi:hypothetical protein